MHKIFCPRCHKYLFDADAAVNVKVRCQGCCRAGEYVLINYVSAKVLFSDLTAVDISSTIKASK